METHMDMHTKQHTCFLHRKNRLYFSRNVIPVHISTLNMEAACFTIEMVVSVSKTICRHNTEYRNLNTHFRQNVTPHVAVSKR